jgi:DNA-binding GntR family transcriptional regulator
MVILIDAAKLQDPLGMTEATSFERRTATDLVFDQLHEEIVCMRLTPGTKLSEVDTARRFGVSRQPVRDAFNRLSNLDLVVVRPQRATEVRGFSLKAIQQTRFIRMSVETEVIRRACDIWDDTCDQRLNENLDKQRLAMEADSIDDFHMHDTQFHRMICELAKCPEAIDTIALCRQKMDRLCMLSMDQTDELSELFDDHTQLTKALRQQTTDEAIAITRHHLSRLDSTIANIHENHQQYFDEIS